MAKLPTQPIVTPKGELAWVFIDGNGKKDLNDKDRYVASLRVKTDSPEHKQLKDVIDAFWEENKGKGWKQKSNGLKTEVYPDSHEKAGEPTGYTLCEMWTGTAHKDGKRKVIAIKTAKNVLVDLKGRKIGNGSIGKLSGLMQIYDQGVAARGVTIYLNSIQLLKFVEFKQDDGFEEEEGEFDGFDDDEFESTEANSDAEPDETPDKVTL